MREDFSLLKKVVYLDSAAGALKPLPVINEISEFYENYPINPHSINSKLGQKVYQKVKTSRKLVASLIEADEEEIIFTSGTTDALNRLAYMFESFIKKDDQIVVSYYNHTSNITPWLELAKRKGAKVVFGNDLISVVNSKTKVVAYAQQNNGLAQVVDHDALYKKVKEVGAVLVNDAAQAIVHQKVSLSKSDVIVFSSNKLYGPTGSGVLAIKEELLSLLKPMNFGGGSTTKIIENEWKCSEGVGGFEPGTMNTAGVIGLAAGVSYHNSLSTEDRSRQEDLTKYAHDQLKLLPNTILYSKKGDQNIIFNLENHNAQDVVAFLGQKGVILRAGTFCNKALYQITNFSTAIRLSVGVYNNKKDIDTAIKEIKNRGDFIEIV